MTPKVVACIVDVLLLVVGGLSNTAVGLIISPLVGIKFGLVIIEK